MTEPRIITAYTAPSGVRVAVVRLQGREVTVRQSVKKVTTVWLGSVRLTKQHNSSIWHAAVGAAFDEWDGKNVPAPAEEQAERPASPHSGVPTYAYPADPARLSVEDCEAANEAGFSYVPEHGGTRTVIVRDGSALGGAVLGRVTLLLAGGRPEFAAYREDGSRVGHGADRLEAALLLRADRDARLGLTPATVTLTNPDLWR